jgi:hypothetical protein
VYNASPLSDRDTQTSPSVDKENTTHTESFTIEVVDLFSKGIAREYRSIFVIALT